MDSPKKSLNQDESIYAIIKDIISANPSIPIKHQQRNEDDLNDEEKFEIVKDIYAKSKLIFFVRFGEYLNESQLNSLDDIFKDVSELNEIRLIIEKLKTRHSAKSVKNRRYEALKRLVQSDSYFSETEMMKRNPLLYEQLVGQYLTQAEIRERDRSSNPHSFVSILLDGIEREQAENTLKFQEEYENNAMEEEESSDEDESAAPLQAIEEVMPSEAEQQPQSLWGEYAEFPSTSKIQIPDPTTHFQRRAEKTINHKPNVSVTSMERRMLRDEFVSLMYESFLAGNDDYDYTEIDNDEQYDDMVTIGLDEEDKYFDSEEPDVGMPVDDDDSDGFIERKRTQSSSEDELDIFMSALNNHPTVCKLTTDMKNLGTNE